MKKRAAGMDMTVAVTRHHQFNRTKDQFNEPNKHQWSENLYDNRIGHIRPRKFIIDSGTPVTLPKSNVNSIIPIRPLETVKQPDK